MVTSGPTAIDDEDVASSESVLGGSEEQGGDGDFVRVAGASERDVIEQALDVVVEEAVFGIEEPACAIGHNGAGGDGVDEDAVSAEFDGHGAREVVDACFGGGEGALQSERHDSGDGGDIDDASSALWAHDFRGGATDLIETGKVHCEDAIPFLTRELVNGDAMRQGVDACVIDDDVEPLAAFDHGAHGGVDLVGLGDIKSESVASTLAGGLLGGGEMDVGVENGGSVCGETIGNGFADAVGGSGDEGDLVFEVGLHG